MGIGFEHGWQQTAVTAFMDRLGHVAWQRLEHLGILYTVHTVSVYSTLYSVQCTQGIHAYCLRILLHCLNLHLNTHILVFYKESILVKI